MKKPVISMLFVGLFAMAAGAGLCLLAGCAVPGAGAKKMSARSKSAPAPAPVVVPPQPVPAAAPVVPPATPAPVQDAAY